MPYAPDTNRQLRRPSASPSGCEMKQLSGCTAGSILGWVASGFVELSEGGGADTTLSAHRYLVRRTHAVSSTKRISKQTWQRLA
jgi:hypothetical protein